MKINRITLLLLLFNFFAFAQSRSGLIPIDDDRLFKVVLEINENNVLARSNNYFRMQAIKVLSDERATDDDEIQSFKSFYYIVIADFEESPRGKLYQTKNLISPTISVFPDSYKFFKILITHGEQQEKQLVMFASNEKVYVKKE